jgi:hypothetical protein
VARLLLLYEHDQVCHTYVDQMNFPQKTFRVLSLQSLDRVTAHVVVVLAENQGNRGVGSFESEFEMTLDPLLHIVDLWNDVAAGTTRIQITSRRCSYAFSISFIDFLDC